MFDSFGLQGPASLHFSPHGEAKWVRGPSGLGASRAEEKGASRLARAGVLELYVEHGKQAQRSPGGRMACFDHRVVRHAGWYGSLPKLARSRRELSGAVLVTVINLPDDFRTPRAMYGMGKVRVVGVSSSWIRQPILDRATNRVLNLHACSRIPDV